MKKILISFFMLGLVLASEITLVSAKPPPWAPAHGYRRKFVYYPNQKVYYDPASSRYFWIDAGIVKIGAKLPDSIKISGTGITLELPREKPIYDDFIKKK